MTFIRASTLRETDMGLLRKAGCVEVQIGLESADQQILQNMDKKATQELYAEVIGKILSAGINCSSYFVFGFPGETCETAQHTRDFIKKHEFPEYEGALSWSLFPFILIPLSPIYEPQNRKKFHLTGYMHRWQHQSMNSNEAKDHIVKTFLTLENSGPIYRGDNQDMLRELGPTQRKKFEAVRHKLSKGTLKGRHGELDILASFTKLLQGNKGVI
jgi:p-methyltransferase